MVIRLGRNGRFLACSMYPEHKESRPLPGDELPPRKAPRGLPEVREAARRQDRAVRAVPRVLALSGVRLHREEARRRRTAAVRGHLPQEQGRPPRPIRPAPGTVFWCSMPQVHSRPPAPLRRRCTTRRRRAAGAQGRGGDPRLRVDERRPGRHRPWRALYRRTAGSGRTGTAGPWRRTSGRWPRRWPSSWWGEGRSARIKPARAPTEPAAEA